MIYVWDEEVVFVYKRRKNAYYSNRFLHREILLKVSVRRIVKAVKRVLGNGKPKKPGAIHRAVCRELDLSCDSDLRSVIWNLVGRGEVKVVGNWNFQLVK